jgi:hypothetical protein
MRGMLPNTMSGIIAHISTFVIRVLRMGMAAPQVTAAMVCDQFLMLGAWLYYAKTALAAK